VSGKEILKIEISDELYPKLLKEISDPPQLLYVRGTLLPEDAASVAIVGTRRATPYGLKMARELARQLAQSGITVVSGLAEGIDGAAHEGALEANGRTIAVLGHGLDRVYPPSHKELSLKITASGALITEFPEGVGPTRYNFPQRNRIISGLSLGVIVVEAPQKSGALITARFASEQGREVFAVPGPVSSRASQGTHALLKDGAKLVESAQDILEELTLPLRQILGTLHLGTVHPGIHFAAGGLSPSKCPSRTSPLSPEEEVLYGAVPVGSGTLADALAQEAKLSASKVLSLLTSLELKGLVRQLPGQGYSRV
jgi:DNA processing protein